MARIGLFLASAGAAACLLVALGGPASAQKAAETPARPVVVELYTSQGCSYCPPADALLGALAERPDVVALTFNVNYWDYLGWPDSLARPENRHRQAAYVKRIGRIDAFTPQMIVGGAFSVVGSRAGEIEAAIDRAAEKPAAAAVTLAREGDEIVLSIAPTAIGLGEDEACKILLVGYHKPQIVKIGAGENQGRKIAYHNVVRDVVEVGVWRGEKRTLRATIDPTLKGYAVLLQGPKVGKIFAAAKLDLD